MRLILRLCVSFSAAFLSVGLFLCVCAHTSCEDGVLGSDWRMRWPCWSLQMAVCILGVPLLAFPLLVSLGGPPAGLLLSLSVKDFDRKKEPDSWHGAEVEEGAEGCCRLCTCYTSLRMAATCCAICFASDKPAVCLPTVEMETLPMNLQCLKKRKKHSYCVFYLLSHIQGGPLWPLWPKLTLCQLSHITVDNKEARRRELWRHLLQQVNKLFVQVEGERQRGGGAKGGGRGPQLMGGSNLRVMKAWFIARDCLLSSFLMSQIDDAPGVLLLLSHLEQTEE